jgi:hypothetical protein
MKNAKPKKYKKKSTVRIVLNYTLMILLGLLVAVLMVVALIIPHININD